MLQITLDIEKADEVSVSVDGRKSHGFRLREVALGSEKALRAFFGDPRAYGERLYAALFPKGSLAETSLAELPKAPYAEGRIVLVLNEPELDAVPWEYMWKDGLLASEYHLIRSLPEGKRPQVRFRGGTGSVRVLFVPSDPLVQGGNPLPVLDVETEWEELKGLAERTPLEVRRLIPPTREEFQRGVLQTPNVLHFSGHGSPGHLIFEGESGEAVPVDARDLAKVIRGRVDLVVLSSCFGAAPSPTSFVSSAREFARNGIPFTVGMQFPIRVDAANRFTDFFYEALSKGEDVAEAVRQARISLEWQDTFQAGMALLYAADPDLVGAFRADGEGRAILPTPYDGRIDLSDLPEPAGFVGRRREMFEIGLKLAEKRTPFVLTLHGVGGIGKTALLKKSSFRFAWRFPDGVLAIPLDRVTSPGQVFSRLERFLNLGDLSHLDYQARLNEIGKRVQGRRLLLSLDNFETLVYAREGGSGEDARKVYGIFRSLSSRGVSLLVTSREKTGLHGERLVEVRGMREEEGARLFLDAISARRDELSIEDARKVSRAVKGHPLALRMLGPAFDDDTEHVDIAGFLKDLRSTLSGLKDPWGEGRHQGLEACFSFSIERLPGNLKEQLGRLFPFRGEFPALLAAPMLFPERDPNESREKTEGVLRTLWEKGLLERGQPLVVSRKEPPLHFYSIHPAISPFVESLPSEEERKEVEENYFRLFRWFGAMCYPASEGGGIYGNAILANIAGRALPDLMYAASMKDDSSGSNLRYHAAFLARHFGDLDTAMELYRQSLEIKESLGDLKGTAAALYEMAHTHAVRGNLDRAMELYRQVLKTQESLGDLQGKSATLHEMAHIHTVRGDLDGAMELYRQALKIDESLGDLKGKSATLHQMAGIYAVRGDLDGAMELYRQSLEIKESLGDLKGKSATLHQMAYIHTVRGDLDGAMELYRQSLEIKESLGDLQGKSATLHEMAGIYAVRGDLDGAMELYRQSLEIKESLGDLKGKSATLAMMAQVLAKRGEIEKAVAALHESLVTLHRMGARPDEGSVKKVIADVRRFVGGERFDRAWKQVTGEEVPPWAVEERDENVVRLEEDEAKELVALAPMALAVAAVGRGDADEETEGRVREALNAMKEDESWAALALALERVMEGGSASTASLDRVEAAIVELAAAAVKDDGALNQLVQIAKLAQNEGT